MQAKRKKKLTCTLSDIIFFKKGRKEMEMTAAASLLLSTDCIWSHFILILLSPACIISPLRFHALFTFSFVVMYWKWIMFFLSLKPEVVLLRDALISVD